MLTDTNYVLTASMVGVTCRTKDPEGGKIYHDERGDITGLLS